MPKRKEPELDPKDQFKKFVETARELEVDPADAERAFSRISKKSVAQKKAKKQ